MQVGESLSVGVGGGLTSAESLLLTHELAHRVDCTVSIYCIFLLLGKWVTIHVGICSHAVDLFT